METPVLIAGAVVLLIFLACLLAVVLHSRAESRRALVAAQAETAALRDRVDQLTEQLERQAATMIRVDDPAYVIADAVVTDASSLQHPVVLERSVSDRVVLSATLGEPLFKAVALGHGLRRALSAESRNKIRFEVRREVRRSRKQRRRELKDAWRRMQAEDRAA